MGNTPTTPKLVDDQSKTYRRLLKDIKKLRIRDETKQYNPHRRDKSILAHLPSNLKQFSKTIHTVNEFWLRNIKRLTPNELQALAMLSYCHLYCEVTPNARKLLLKANKGNVPSHTITIFTIFEYVIRIMTDSTPLSHSKLFKQLKNIGLLHKPLNLTNLDVYEMILQSFNYAMEQTFRSKYTVRIRFCFTQLYRVIVNIMNNNDLQTMVLTDSISRSQTQEDIKIDSQYILQDVDQFLSSFEDCLSDEIGSLYFKKFLEEQFCVENYLFHKAVLKYKSVKKGQRIKVGTDIIDTYIKDDSEKQVNLSSGTRNKILSIIHLTKRMNDNKDKYQDLLTLTKDTSETTDGLIQLSRVTQKREKYDVKLEDIIYSAGFTDHLFDAAYDEIFFLMRTNLWMSFRNTILGYCNDSFIQQQQIKYRDRKKESQVRRNIIKNVNDLAKLKQSERNSIIVISTVSTPSINASIHTLSKLGASKKSGHMQCVNEEKMDYLSSTPEYDGDSEGSHHDDKNRMMISRLSPNLRPKPIRTVPKYEFGDINDKESAMMIPLCVRSSTQKITNVRGPLLIESSKTSLRMLCQSSNSNENTRICRVSSHELLDLDFNDNSLKSVD